MNLGIRERTMVIIAVENIVRILLDNLVNGLLLLYPLVVIEPRDIFGSPHVDSDITLDHATEIKLLP